METKINHGFNLDDPELKEIQMSIFDYLVDPMFDQNDEEVQP